MPQPDPNVRLAEVDNAERPEVERRWYDNFTKEMMDAELDRYEGFLDDAEKAAYRVRQAVEPSARPAESAWEDVHDLPQTAERVHARIAELERERDAAVALLRQLVDCYEADTWHGVTTWERVAETQRRDDALYAATAFLAAHPQPTAARPQTEKP